MSGLAVCTIVAGNYLAPARVLDASFRRFHPELPLHVLLADDERGCRAAEAAGLTVVRPSEPALADLQGMLARYGCKEFAMALKPTILRHLLERGHSSVLFLDSDVLVTASLAPLFELVARHALCLSPHLGPAADDAQRRRMEDILLQAGIYNAGLIGVSDQPEAHRFLRWWEARLATHCRFAIDEGLHFDQRWLDLAPGFVADLHLIRDPGCNLAYWNLSGQRLERDDAGYTIAGQRLRFFHFSGFDPQHPQQLSRYAPESCFPAATALDDLLRDYAARLAAAGWAEGSAKQWRWGPEHNAGRRWERVWQRLSKRRPPPMA